MISPSALQQSLLSLLCFSDDTSLILSSRITSEIFLGRQNKLIASTALEYIRLYNRAPNSQIELLLEHELRRGEEGKLLGQTLDILKAQFSSIQPEFILRELETFEEIQKLTLASQTALEDLSRGDLDAAKLALSKTRILSTSSHGKDEIFLSDSKGMLRFLDKGDNEFISSGVDAIDNVGARPERKTLTIFVASTGKGKTWFLINVVKAALQHHHKPLYITLELSAEMAARRLLQNLFSLSKDEAQQVRTSYFDRDVNNNAVILFRELQRDSILNKRKEISRKLAELLSCPPMVIKEFPSGSLTIDALETYLDYLEKEKNFIPDIVILDYAELMRLDTGNLRIDIGRLFVALRGISNKRNHALITASQGNRESDNAKTVDRTHIAEDWSKIGTADLVFTYSQTPEEYKLGLSRILIAKSRNSQDRIMVLNSQAYTYGQFSLDSIVMSRGVFQEIERLTTTE